MIEEIKEILYNNPRQEHSFFVCDTNIVEKLIDTWTYIFPKITPHYAIKSNDDKVLLHILARRGVNFDCASRTEIERVILTGVHPNRIIFAHPMKNQSDIEFARDVGVNLTTFDSTYELDKMKELHPKCGMILRIKSDDPNAIVQLGNKFGALEDEIGGLLQYAKNVDMDVIGISFHVGSSSRNPESYYRAIKAAKIAFDIARGIGHTPYLLDIGGGFHADIDEDGVSTYVADYINDAIEEFFDEEKNIKIVAEPGRFFSEHYAVLVCRVVGKRDRDGRYEYFLNDGVYGGLSNIIYEKAKPVPISVCDIPEDEEWFPATFFGPTCDGIDMIITDISLPELHIDDWVYFEKWGAYSMCLYTKFNGLGDHDVYYKDA